MELSTWKFEPDQVNVKRWEPERAGPSLLVYITTIMVVFTITILIPTPIRIRIIAIVLAIVLAIPIPIVLAITIAFTVAIAISIAIARLDLTPRLPRHSFPFRVYWVPDVL